MTDMTDEQILELTPELMFNIIKGRGEIIDYYRKEVERLNEQNNNLYTANEQLCYENKKLEDTIREIRMLTNMVVS